MRDLHVIGKVEALISLGYNFYGSEDVGFTFYDKHGKSIDNEPTNAEIDAEVTRLKAEHVTQAYARNREKEYPSTGDQLDMMYKDTKNSTTTHADAVEAVKTKWPKDNSGPIE